MDTDRKPNLALCKLLTDPTVDKAIYGALRAKGWPHGDLEDGLGVVRLKAFTAFTKRRVKADTPGAMAAFCRKIARDACVDRFRRLGRDVLAARRSKRDPDSLPLPPTRVARDPADVARLLGILGELFREGRMPEGGMEILQGVAAGVTYGAIGAELKISDEAVRGRLDTMRKHFREVVVARGLGELAPPEESADPEPGKTGTSG